MFTVPQVVGVILWFTFYNIITTLTGFGLVAGGVVLNGLVTGLIMGDVADGFYLGGTYELMNIGLNPLGGSSVPNYNMGVVVGVAFGAVSGLDTGMAVGIVVATLASSLDVFAKMCGSFFLHKAQNKFEEEDISGARRWIWLGVWPKLILTAILPLIIVFAFGDPIVEAINSFIPAWLLQGFKNAGNMLPAIGFAILLRSMNLHGNLQYLIIGFVLYAYMNVPVLGIALIGVSLAMLAYYNQQKLTDVANNAGGLGDE